MKIIKQKFRKRIKPNEQREITKVGRAYERRKGKNHESCCIENNECKQESIKAWQME